MFTVYVDEYRYGDVVPNTNAKLVFKSIDEIIKWFDSLDETTEKNKSRITFKDDFTCLEISIPTQSWGSIYMYSIKRISSSEGILFERSKHAGKRIKEAFIDYKNNIAKPLTYID